MVGDRKCFEEKAGQSLRFIFSQILVMKYGFYTWDASRSYIKQNSIFQKAIAHFPTYA